MKGLNLYCFVELRQLSFPLPPMAQVIPLIPPPCRPRLRTLASTSPAPHGMEVSPMDHTHQVGRRRKKKKDDDNKYEKEQPDKARILRSITAPSLPLYHAYYYFVLLLSLALLGLPLHQLHIIKDSFSYPRRRVLLCDAGTRARSL